ncbi:MAG: glycosyltransferase family 2 protein [Elusimicrobia bacterium]|nr:glycosyltransferase family 2 protein [Elusimicrobiota bacterium]
MLGTAMADLFFSVVLPTYNRARMALTALKTVRLQTSPDWECLAVDDGSTDGTAQILSRLADDPRIRILTSERNLGMNASRNRAIQEARGRFVTFLDSDDLWLAPRLERFRRRLTEVPESGFLFSNAYVWRYNRILGTLFDPARAIPEGVVPGHYAVGDGHLPYVTTNVAIRRDAFERWGTFRTEMKTLDTELFARFLNAGLPVAAIREPLSVRRIHEGQLTGRHIENFEEALRALESSGASAEIRRERRKAICLEVALYLLKEGEPGQARSLLLRELGSGARATSIFRWTSVPRPALKAAKKLRRLWLTASRHPALASPELRRLYDWLAPLIEAERVSD